MWFYYTAKYCISNTTHLRRQSSRLPEKSWSSRPMIRRVMRFNCQRNASCGGFFNDFRLKRCNYTHRGEIRYIIIERRKYDSNYIVQLYRTNNSRSLKILYCITTRTVFSVILSAMKLKAHLVRNVVNRQTALLLPFVKPLEWYAASTRFKASCIYILIEICARVWRENDNNLISSHLHSVRAGAHTINIYHFVG